MDSRITRAEKRLMDNMMDNKDKFGYYSDLIEIPPEEQAYEWARKEMERYFPNPDHFILVNLEENAPDTVNKSLFKKGEDDPVILRVYWPDTDSFKYSVIINFDDMMEECPGFVGQLLLNGQYAFEEAVRKSPQYVNELLYGKTSGSLS